jgi:penicillin-binding protein 2
VIGRISVLTGVSVDDINKRITEARARAETFNPINLVTNAPKDMALSIEENVNLGRLPGVRLQVDSVRQYVEGDSLAHILGYVGRISAEEYDRLRERGYLLNDRLGKVGVELMMEEELRGRFGRETVEYDASGERIQVLGREDPIPGRSLNLTIDVALQAQMRESLERWKRDSLQSVGIAMDPRTGEILAMVSLPGYDNNLFSRPISQADLNRLTTDPRRPLVNHAIASAFPPGSIYKPIVGAAALQEGIATPNTVITSTGSITVANQFDPNAPGYVFRDWRALGSLDFRQGLAMSSDVYYYYLAGGFKEPGGRDFKGLGPQRIADYSRRFGLGRPTGINLAGEASGNIPTPEQVQRTFGQPWVLGDTYNMGIGQGYVLTTPIQMLNMTAAIANGGTLWEPQIVRDVIDSEGRVVRPYQRRALSTVEVAPQHLQVIREAMRLTVTNGTAPILQTVGISNAGKTGTAEYTARDPITGYGKTHGWYVGWAPYENPEIAFVIFQQSGSGGENGVTVAAEFLKFWAERRANGTSTQKSQGVR